MDIFNKNKRKVVCVANDEREMCVDSSNAPLLEVGKEYELTSVEVYDWYTLVTLKEFGNKKFNSVYFEEKKSA